MDDNCGTVVFFFHVATDVWCQNCNEVIFKVFTSDMKDFEVIKVQNCVKLGPYMLTESDRTKTVHMN